MSKHKIENGVHDLPNHVYHASEGVSRSGLLTLKRSPFHYWQKYINPNAEPESVTPDLKLGEYVHALVLEPQHFNERYIVEPVLTPAPKCGLLKDLGREEYDRQKAQREAFLCANEMAMDEFQEKAKDREIIKPDIYNYAKEIADTVLSYDIARELFDSALIEKSIYFTHEETGLQCKVKPDAWLGSIVTDLKTCKDASLNGFKGAAYKGGYFLQAAMIKRALQSIDIELEKFIFFCAEKSPGIPCAFYPVSDIAMYRGEKEFDKLMFKLADCLHKDQWPCYEPQELDYPNYALYEYEEE